MAYTPCTTSTMAGNLAENCDNAAFEGLKALAVAFPRRDVATLTRGTGAQKNIVSAIQLAQDKKTFVISASGETAWADSGEDYDPATKSWNKTANFVAPDYGAEIAVAALEPMAKDNDGFVVILQRKNERGEGSFVIVGLEKGAVVTAMSRKDTDTATKGCASLTLTEKNAPSSEINFFVTDFETTKAAFDALVAQSF